MGPILAGLAKAAIPLIGGLFGGKKEQTTRTNFVQLRNDALAAGFNPLTALRATGGAGNTTTTLPTMSSGEFIAQALGAGIEGYMNYDPYEKQRSQYETEILRKEAERSYTPFVPTGSAGPSGPASVSSGPGTGVVPAITPALLSDDGSTETQPLFIELVGDDGTTTRVPAGLDWDEMLSGALIHGEQTFRNSFYGKKLMEFTANSRARAEKNKAAQAKQKRTNTFDYPFWDTENWITKDPKKTPLGSFVEQFAPFSGNELPYDPFAGF